MDMPDHAAPGIPEGMTAATFAESLRLGLAQESFPDYVRYCVVEDPEAPTGVRLMEPWPHLLELAASWGRGDSEIDLKARQMGFTWLAADFLCWKAQRKPNTTCIVLSQGEREAIAIGHRVGVVHRHLPAALQVAITKHTSEGIFFANGSRILTFPATERAARSYTAEVVLVDEAAFHPYARENYAAYRPTVADGGQLLMISTANGTNFFAEMFWAAYHGENEYTGRFYPWDARPDRDAAWRAQEDTAYVGHSDDFHQEYPATPQQAFANRVGLVFPQFSVGDHVLGHDPWRWQDSKVRVAGVDFGGGDPTAIVSLGMSGTGRIHQFDEYYTRAPVGIEELGAWLAEHGPFDAILCDPSESTAITSLRAGLGPSVRAANNRRDAIEILGGLYKQGRLTIAERCTESIKEFPGYKRRERKDPNSKENYETHTPVNHHADAHDARRYAVVWLLQFELGNRAGHVSRLGGGRLSTKAV